MLLGPSTAAAQEWRFDLGAGVGFLIAGDSAVRGRKANPTGGSTLLPYGRARVSIPRAAWLDALGSVTPMFVTPWSLDKLGLVVAHDLGIDIHPANRAWSVGLAGTVAPSYARFCNIRWCLKEPLFIGGGIASVTVNVVQDNRGRGLHGLLAGRLLYARPTAWTWPSLTPAERRIIPTMGMITGGGAWVF